MGCCTFDRVRSPLLSNPRARGTKGFFPCVLARTDWPAEDIQKRLKTRRAGTAPWMGVKTKWLLEWDTNVT